MNKKISSVTNEAETALINYHFPGNIRELQSIIYDAVSTHKSKIMSLSIFKKHISEHKATEQKNNFSEKRN